MTRVSTVEQIRRRSVARAVAYRADVATADGGTWHCPWSRLRPYRRDLYLSGTRKFGKDLAEALRERYPAAFDVYDSEAWSHLEPQTARQRRGKLHQACAMGSFEMPTSDLLSEVARGAITPKGDELAQAGAFVGALELAREENLDAPLVGLGMRLARVLLLLTGCPMRVWAGGELWRYCDRIVRNLRHEGLTLRFEDDTWEWFAAYAQEVRVYCQRVAFLDFYRKDLPFSIMCTLLAELADGLATTDRSKSVRYLRAFSIMSPVKAHQNMKHETVEALGLWRVK